MVRFVLDVAHDLGEAFETALQLSVSAVQASASTSRAGRPVITRVSWAATGHRGRSSAPALSASGCGPSPVGLDEPPPARRARPGAAGYQTGPAPFPLRRTDWYRLQRGVETGPDNSRAASRDGMMSVRLNVEAPRE